MSDDSVEVAMEGVDSMMELERPGEEKKKRSEEKMVAKSGSEEEEEEETEEGDGGLESLV